MASGFNFGLFSHRAFSSFLPVRRFSSGAAPLSRCAASLLSCFSEEHSLFFAFSGTALLFSDSTRKCLFPFNAHLRLNRIRCRRVSGLFFPQSLQKALCSFIYTACEGNRQVPVSTLRQSRFIRFAEIPHADCPSNPNTLPSCRLFVFKVCFRFFRNLCVFRGLSLEEGIFCLLNRFFIDSFLFPYPFPFFGSLFVKLFFTL